MSGRFSALRRAWPAVVVAVITLVLLVALGTKGNDETDRPRATPEIAESATTGAPASDGLGTVAMSDLPGEARTTIGLIDQGGPYPYDQDDSVFGNREGLLPDAPRGSYREYTVKTPGESDRGARRIVKARDGTLYYTDDHYGTFERVTR